MELTEIEATVKRTLLEGGGWKPPLAVETHNDKGVLLFPKLAGSLEEGAADQLFHLGRSIELSQGPITAACLVTNQGRLGDDGKPYNEHLVFSLLVTNPKPLIRACTYQVIRDHAGAFCDLLISERDAEGFDERKYIDPFMLCFTVGVSTARRGYDEAHAELGKYLESFHKLRDYYEQGDVDE